MRTLAENEAFVESHWLDMTPMIYGRFDICDPEGEMNWAAGAEFTEDRQEEIRQVEAEMLCANIHAFTAANNCLIAVQKGQANKAGRWARHTITRSRILAREQAALESLKKGWIA